MKIQRHDLRRIALTPLAVAACQVLLAGPATAQTSAAPAAQATNDADAIIVTSRRIKERLQDVPVSVTAIGAEQIQDAGITSMEDVARLTPGFSFERTTGSLAQPTIRGQAQTRVTNPVQNVATYFNGVYLQRSYQVDSDLLGLERVEVIKGPQSALFGRNAFAGAVSYVTLKPSLEKTMLRGEVTLGDNERRDLKVMASIPFGGKAALSFAGSTSEFDGTWPNNSATAAAVSGPGVRTSGKLNGYDNKSGLLQLRLQPTESSELSFFWSNRTLTTESPANYQMAARGLITNYNNMNCRPFEAALQPALGVNALYCGALPARPQLAPGEPRSPGLVADRRTYGQDTSSNIYGATLEWLLTDRLTLTGTLARTTATSSNIATLARDPQRGVESAPALPFVVGRVLLDSRGNGSITSDSAEVRLAYDSRQLRYMLGVYDSTVSNLDYGATYAPVAGAGAEPSVVSLLAGGDLFPPGFSATQRNESIRGVFGSVTAEVMTDLRVTAEARWTSEKIVQQAVTYPALAAAGPQFSRVFTYVTPRLTADWRLSPAALMYASAAEGVKSGGFNPAATLASDQVYEPEKNWTYELGLKTNSADGSLLFNVSGFVVDWTNLQGNRPQTGAAIGTPAIIGNVSGADVKGFEASLRWRPLRQLTVDASAAYTRAVYKDGAIDTTIARSVCSPATVATTCPFAALNNIGGKTVPRAPGTMASLAGTWRSSLGNVMGKELTLTTRADVSYQSKIFVDPMNLAWAPARTLVIGSIGLESANWSLRLWGRNLADREYVSYAFVTFGGGGAGSGVTYAPLLGDRRAVGATLTLSY